MLDYHVEIGYIRFLTNPYQYINKYRLNMKKHIMQPAILNYEKDEMMLDLFQ
jgi:hypothetical protein